MGNRIPTNVQARVLELLSQGKAQNEVARLLSLARSSVQIIAKNGVVVEPNKKKYYPKIVPSIFEDTEPKRCVECGKMMKIGFEDDTCLECNTVTQLEKGAKENDHKKIMEDNRPR